jgi:hypothetical protein
LKKALAESTEGKKQEKSYSHGYVIPLIIFFKLKQKRLKTDQYSSPTPTHQKKQTMSYCIYSHFIEKTTFPNE